MVRKVYLFVLLLVCMGGVFSQEEDGVMPQIQSLADQAQELVMSCLDERAGIDCNIAISGIDVSGSQVMLGKVFSLKLTTALANRNMRGVTVLSRDYAGLLRSERQLLVLGEEDSPPNSGAEYLVTGSAFISDNEVLVVIQVISVLDSAVLGGFERKLPLTDGLRAYLRRSEAQMPGSDTYEPDNDFENASVLVSGDVVSGHTLSPAGDADWFIFTTGDLFSDSIVMLRIFTTGSTDTYIALYGPDDPYTLLAENDDNEALEGENAGVSISVTSGQTYWIKVRGYDESTTGPYNIITEFEEAFLDDAEPDNTREESSTLSLDGEALHRSLVPNGDVDWFHFDVSRDAVGSKVLTVETMGNTDTYMELADPNHDVISDDDSGTDDNARLQFIPRYAGRYYLSVSHYEESNIGDYSISAWLESAVLDAYEPDNSPEEATVIEVNGERQRHAFVPAGEEDWLFFSVRERSRIDIKTSGETDTYLALFRQGAVSEGMIAEDDDSGDDYNAFLSEYLEAGDYYIKVTQIFDDAILGNEYSISVREVRE